MVQKKEMGCPALVRGHGEDRLWFFTLPSPAVPSRTPTLLSVWPINMALLKTCFNEKVLYQRFACKPAINMRLSLCSYFSLDGTLLWVMGPLHAIACVGPFLVLRNPNTPSLSNVPRIRPIRRYLESSLLSARAKETRTFPLSLPLPPIPDSWH